MVRINNGPSNNPFTAVKFKTQAPQAFKAGNPINNLHSSPIKDVFVKAGTEKIQKEINVISNVLNKVATIKDKVSSKFPKVANVTASAKNKVSDVAGKVASTVVPKFVKAKMLAQKPVAELSAMLKNSISKIS